MEEDVNFYWIRHARLNTPLVSNGK